MDIIKDIFPFVIIGTIILFGFLGYREQLSRWIPFIRTQKYKDLKKLRDCGIELGEPIDVLKDIISLCQGYKLFGYTDAYPLDSSIVRKSFLSQLKHLTLMAEVIIANIELIEEIENE